MLKRFFRGPPPLEEMIPQAIRKLKVQHVKLEQVVVRLRKRDHILFNRCTIAIKNQERERAIILANELAEIRKLIGIVTQTQIVIERIIIRLETIKELNSIVVDLKPVLKVLKSVTRSLDTAMPEVAHELNRVSETITETLALTQISSPQPIVQLSATSPGSEEILKEASEILREELTTRLPEPPASVILTEKAKQVREMKQAVALAASCSEAYEHGDSQDYVYKDMEFQRLSLKIQRPSSLEDKLLEYLRRSQGPLEIARCATDLNVSPRDVEKALESLGAQGKIKIKTTQ